MGQKKAAIRLPSELPSFEASTTSVIQQELDHYIQERRMENGLPPASAHDLVGMCISGGGVRAATLGLGMLQSFIRANRLRTIDYLSTVSGGGFIGSCLSSLLSEEAPWVDKQKTIPNVNHRFSPEVLGLDAATSPFIPKEEDLNYQKAASSKLNAQLQLRHLRQHGAYLTPRTGLFTWDVRRALGALSGGMVVNFTIYFLLVAAAVLVHHVLLGWLSLDQFLDQIRSFAANVGEGQLLLVRTAYWTAGWEVLRSTTGLIWLFGSLGVVAGLIFLRWLRHFPQQIARQLADERRYDGREEGKLHQRPGMVPLEIQQTRFFRRVLSVVAYFGGPLLAYSVVGYGMNSGWMKGSEYFIFLVLPFFFNLGMFAIVHLMVTFHFINRRKEQVSGRFYRDLFYGVQGSVLIGLVLTALFPLGITLLFSQYTLLSKLLAVAFGIVVVLKISTSALSRWSYVALFLKSLHGLLLNWSVVLFIGLSFALLSGILFQMECLWASFLGIMRWEASSFLLIGILLFLVVIGFLANNNDISLHYFFRDRLSEAYLRTNGYVVQEQKEGHGTALKDLVDINFRNHDNLLLQSIGDGNNRGPYPILISAINLQAAAGRKRQRSDHFIFSKFYIGSDTTGYYRTDRYNGGQTRLSTAMTISAAAVSGGMGLFGFAASHFYMTLLNLRTGYWVYNPAFLKVKEEKRMERQVVKRSEDVLASSMWMKLTFPFQQTRRYLQRRWASSTFWLGYLAAEFLGRLTAEQKLVYLSDGGHTGDNLGLIPLIQRKCQVIYLADFEEDESYTFSSFSQAVKQAEANYGTRIRIDLSPLVPSNRKSKGPKTSVSSAVLGEVEYPDGAKGILVYMKSAIRWAEHERESDFPASDRPPVLSANYFQTNPLFPHQPTADQYFNEVQFEAYRLLGEDIGEQALRLSNRAGVNSAS